LGFDAAKVTAQMDSAEVMAVIQANHDLAGALSITGTPTFILNGKKLEVNQWPQLEPLLQRAGAR
jgi:protein-disulfide isomerase